MTIRVKSIATMGCLIASVGMLSLPPAQGQQGTFFPPLTNGDGIRYPLVLSPAIWQIEGSVAVAPGSDGLVHLAYVLRMTNVLPGSMNIQSIQIVDPFADYKEVGVNQVVATDNSDITGKVNPIPAPGSLDGSAYVSCLKAGESGVMFLDITFPDLAAVPAYVSHRITVVQKGDNGEEHTYIATDAPVAVYRGNPIVLSPPLHGGRWLNGDSCCKPIGGHRWAMTPVNGRGEPVETFAEDLVQLRKDGRVYAGPVNELSSYAYYGANVYSATDGTVVEVVRNLKDQTPGTNPQVTVAEAAGNHVIVEMQGKYYVQYAHLAPGSVQVQVGDSVVTGQVLGKLGNTGSTQFPHLHFQVSDEPSFLSGHPLPFVFEHTQRRFRYAGASLDEEAKDTISGEPVPLVPATPVDLVGVMPLTFDVLNFY
jgi:biotin carboxyl carrier protein